MFDLKLNGYPVVFEVRLETEPGEGWKGSSSIAVCNDLTELNKVIQETVVPEYWVLVVDLQDKYPENYFGDEEND